MHCDIKYSSIKKNKKKDNFCIHRLPEKSRPIFLVVCKNSLVTVKFSREAGLPAVSPVWDHGEVLWCGCRLACRRGFLVRCIDGVQYGKKCWTKTLRQCDTSFMKNAMLEMCLDKSLFEYFDERRTSQVLFTTNPWVLQVNVM